MIPSIFFSLTRLATDSISALLFAMYGISVMIIWCLSSSMVALERTLSRPRPVV